MPGMPCSGGPSTSTGCSSLRMRKGWSISGLARPSRGDCIAGTAHPEYHAPGRSHHRRHPHGVPVDENTEAPVELNIWFPDSNALFVAENARHRSTIS